MKMGLLWGLLGGGIRAGGLWRWLLILVGGDGRGGWYGLAVLCWVGGLPVTVLNP